MPIKARYECFIPVFPGRVILMACMFSLLTACKIQLDVPAGGVVATMSGSVLCTAEKSCQIEVSDDHFDETFIAIPDADYQFIEWQRTTNYLCSGVTKPCRLFTTFIRDYPELLQLLAEDKSYHLAPIFVPERTYDFSSLEAYIEKFVTESPYNGASVLIIDKYRGVVYQYAAGDMGLDTVVQLRSITKLASVSMLMAMEKPIGFNFRVTQPIAEYLPFDGFYGDRTAEQLMSNTSGIPGKDFTQIYGPHLCQYSPAANLGKCGKTIYQHLLPDVFPPGTVYSYGGSQWQLAGLVAEHVGNAQWNSLFQRYIRKPCSMNVLTYGNMLIAAEAEKWNGDPSSLTGQDNPNIEAGAISNLADLGKLLDMHLNDGWCGHHQVMKAGAAAFLRTNRKLPMMPPLAETGGGYGMSWWIRPVEEQWHNGIYYVVGGMGSHVWIDINGDYGGIFLVETDPPGPAYDEAWSFVYGGLFQLVREIMETAD